MSHNTSSLNKFRVKCPKCGFSGFRDDFIDCEVYCEDCGSHPAVICPDCKETYDFVYDIICLDCGLIHGKYEECDCEKKSTADWEPDNP